MLRMKIGIIACMLLLAGILIIDKSLVLGSIIAIPLNILSGVLTAYLLLKDSRQEDGAPPQDTGQPPRPTSSLGRLPRKTAACFAAFQLIITGASSLILLHKADFSFTEQVNYWVDRGELTISNEAMQALQDGALGNMVLATLPMVIILNSLLIGLYYRKPSLLVFLISDVTAYVIDQLYATYYNIPNTFDDFRDTLAHPETSPPELVASSMTWIFSAFGLFFAMGVVGWLVAVFVNWLVRRFRAT